MRRRVLALACRFGSVSGCQIGKCKRQGWDPKVTGHFSENRGGQPLTEKPTDRNMGIEPYANSAAVRV